MILKNKICILFLHCSNDDVTIKNYETITTPTRCILHNFCDNQYLLRTLILRKITPKQIYNIHNNIFFCMIFLK